MNNNKNGIIIMAGGLGKRMKSKIPKVLHLFHNIPMLIRIIRQAKKLIPHKILIVVGKYKHIIEKTIIKWENNLNGIQFVMQEPANGTGHAIQCCVPDIKKYDLSKVLILNGDNPLIKSETMIKMFNKLNEKNNCCIMTTHLDKPQGNGRIILDKNSIFNKIIEEKDCNEEEKKIDLVNSGLYCFNSHVLVDNIMKLNNNNAQNEYYLTDVMEIIKNNTKTNIDYIIHPKNKQYELIGINTKEHLEEFEKDALNHNWV